MKRLILIIILSLISVVAYSNNDTNIPVRQILVESQIVIANSSFSKELGVRFNHSGNESLGGEDLGYGNEIILEGESNDGIQFLAVGKIGSYLLQLELPAMQEEGRGEIYLVSIVITGNQQETVITAGLKIPYYQTTSLDTVTKIQFKQTVLEFKVTPQINSDERINMTLAIKKGVLDKKKGEGETNIDKQEVKTNILVDSGVTVVLGGFYEHQQNNRFRRIPFLSGLSLIGNLFRHKTFKNEKSELLIFVTPKILKNRGHASIYP